MNHSRVALSAYVACMLVVPCSACDESEGVAAFTPADGGPSLSYGSDAGPDSAADGGPESAAGNDGNAPGTGDDVGTAPSPDTGGGPVTLNPPNTYVQLFKWRWKDIA